MKFLWQLEEARRNNLEVVKTMFYYAVELDGDFKIFRTAGINGADKISETRTFIRMDNCIPVFGEVK